MGWMPTAVDISAWNSIWTVERIRESQYKTDHEGNAAGI
jgi:hypothetical protein